VRERLVAQVPDVTRLLDRLEEMRLVERERDAEDRRLVNTRITREGLKLLAGLDAPIQAIHRAQLGHLEARELRTLIDLLARCRERA
jgi:DNA-binding MarR family transcriptional regulator